MSDAEHRPAPDDEALDVPPPAPADGYSQRQLFGFLLVSLGVVGAILGGLVAVLVERRR